MSRRHKTLRISTHFFASLFSHGVKAFEVVEDGLPVDAVVVNAAMSPDFGSVVLLVQSDRFEDVAEGEPFPEISPKMTSPKFTWVAEAKHES